MMISLTATSTTSRSWTTASTLRTSFKSTLLSFAIFACFLFSYSAAHYNQAQYGVPQQQQQQVYHQQQQQGVPVQQYQQVPVAGQQQQQQVVYQQQPPQQVVYQNPGGQPHPAIQQPIQAHIPHYQEAPAAGQNVLHDASRIHDKEHMKEHLHEALGDQDVNKLSEEELQFHYFKMHDNDNNNMLDGSELIKSLIHWHVEESKQMGQNAPPTGTTKVFTDAELEQMIDPILQMDDKNSDGFIDYGEFVSAQKTRGF